MHGFPLYLVDHATADSLRIMEEIMNRDMKDQANIQAYGIGLAFGGSDN